jgi:hypothetical protein
MAKMVREKASALGVRFPAGTQDRLAAFEYYRKNHQKLHARYAGRYVAIGGKGVVDDSSDRKELLEKVKRVMSSVYIKYIPEKGTVTLY